MTLQMSNWELALIANAREALRSPTLSVASHTSADLLEDAYHYCAEITQVSSRTFYLASQLLSKSKQRAAHALYAFCRVTDDLVDKADSPQHALMALQHWRERAHHTPPVWNKVLVAWDDTRARFNIPQGLVDQLGYSP